MKVKILKNSKDKIEHMVIFIAGCIILVPFIYAFFYCPSQDFWDSMFSNLMATGLALIAGIPVGLWLDRYAQRAQDVRLGKHEREKEIKILNLIKEELDFSLNTIFIPTRKGNTQHIQIQQYKTNLWNALIASEEIKYIQSPELLNRIASAYYVVEMVKEIENQAFITLRTSAISFTLPDGSTKTASAVLIEDARQFDRILEENVTRALEEITLAIQKKTTSEELQG